MPRHVLVVCLLCLLLLPLSQGVADDEAPGLVNEVKRLRAELAALTARVATLEQKEAQRSGMVAIVGTYVLDRGAFEALLLEGALKSSAAYLAGIEDAAERARARAAIADSAREQANTADVSLTLSPDGTFVMRTKLDQDADESRGTWTSRGAEIALTTSVRDDQPLKQPEQMQAQLAGGTLRLKSSPEDLAVLVLRRR